MANKPKDLVLVHGRTADGAGVNVLRAREERLEIGTMRPLEEGRPIHGEVVTLKPRPEFPMLFDAETQVMAPKTEGSDVPSPPVAATDSAAGSRGATQGPAQVASDSYRKNWDNIWKKRLMN